MEAREYYYYRRAIYGDITSWHKAILVDAAGSLLASTEPMAQAIKVDSGMTCFDLGAARFRVPGLELQDLGSHDGSCKIRLHHRKKSQDSHRRQEAVDTCSHQMASCLITLKIAVR